MIDHNNLPLPGDFRHVCPLQLRFSDVDVLGHVNNTVYLSFYDTGKAHYFSAVRGERMDWEHVDTVIANVNCAYINPIFFGDEIAVATRCESIGEKSFHLLQMLFEQRTGQIKSVCQTVMVSYDAVEKKSTPLSEEWRKALCEFEGKDLNHEP